MSKGQLLEADSDCVQRERCFSCYDYGRRSKYLKISPLSSGQRTEKHAELGTRLILDLAVLRNEIRLSVAVMEMKYLTLESVR